MSSITDLINSLADLTINDRYLLYSFLLSDMRKHEEYLIPDCENANSVDLNSDVTYGSLSRINKLKHALSQLKFLDFLKSLLIKRKETAIVELSKVLPLFNSRSTEAKIVLFKVLPVLFSYCTLYEMQFPEVLKIIDTLKFHSAFVSDQNILVQWYTIFERRRLSKKEFSYKDETYARHLPRLELNMNLIGYSEVALLRAFHRWLRLHRLHKYLFFFANLSYEEVLSIDETNISIYEKKIGLLQLTIGAKNKILREVESLRRRSSLLNKIITKNFHLPLEIDNGIREIKKILRTPIMVRDDYRENLPQLLVDALNKMCIVILEHVGKSEAIIPLYGLLISVLKEAWNYNIFSVKEKDRLNYVRNVLFETITRRSTKNASKKFDESISTFTIDHFVP